MTCRSALTFMALLAAGPALAQGTSGASLQPSIAVDGEAAATVRPDIAILSLGVVTQRPRALDAAAENAKVVANVVEAIRAEGIGPGDVATTSIGLSPVVDASGSGAKKPSAYEASNELSVKVRQVDRAGILLATLIERGVDIVQHVSFEVEGEAALRDGLRADAARDARRRAETYASALGLRLGRVLDIRPGQSRGIAQDYRMATAMAPVTIESGRQTLTEQVSVTFALGPGVLPDAK